MFHATQQTSHKKSFRMCPKGLENIVLYSVELLFIRRAVRRRYKLIQKIPYLIRLFPYLIRLFTDSAMIRDFPL